MLPANNKEMRDMSDMSNKSKKCQKSQKCQKCQCPEDDGVEEELSRECFVAAVAMR